MRLFRLEIKRIFEVTAHPDYTCNRTFAFRSHGIPAYFI